jgi:hypothetical protein
MKKRYIVLGLSAFLALALAVPALGGPSNPIADTAANTKKTAKKALKKAKAAQSSADAAQSDANKASDAAAAAQTTADGAQAAADAAQATANSKFGSTAFVNGETSVESAASKASTAVCPENTQPTGGGHSLGGSEPEDATVVYSGTPIYGGGWTAIANELDGQAGTWTITAAAVCASTTAP